MTFDHQLILIGRDWEEDEIGEQVPVETRTEVLCKIKSVGRAEFYGAATTGLRPEVVFVIHDCEYNGEQEAEYKGERYKVLRTYKGGATRQGAKLAFGEVELVCERVITNG